MTSYILIGERHDDTHNSISLVDQLLESCKAKGLKAVFYPEDQSLARNEEVHQPKRQKLSQDQSLAPNEKVSLLGNRETTVLDPFYVPIAGVASDGGSFTGATGAFSEVMKKITDPTAEGFIGINPAFLPSIERQLQKIQDEGFAIDDPKNFGKYIQGVDHSMLLSSAIAAHMVGELKKHQKDEDVVIVLTGFNHTENMMTKLGLHKSEIAVISNCENEFSENGYLKEVDVQKFELDAKTKLPIIPQSIEKKLTELQKEKKSESFVAKLGLKKPDEKPGSFVEAMQADEYGKMKSSGGFNEL
jgi:hypothetical protein